MSPSCNLRWSFTTWLSDLIHGNSQEGWRDTSMEPALRGWRRWFDYEHSIWLLFHNASSWSEFPALLLRALSILWTACVVFLPLLWTEFHA